MSSSLRARNHSNGHHDYGNSSTTPKTRTLTASWHEIPEWMQDNEYILTGYRREQGSWIGCFHSILGYLHNETVNIHSHLWAAGLFLGFLVTLHSTHIARYEGTTWKDSLVLAIFLISAIFCLTCSALFHVSTCHSEPVCARCHAFDYSGIVVLTVGSFYPCIYYGFYCEPLYQWLYLSTVTIAGVGAAYIVLNPEYSKPTHRGARTKVFIGLGLSGVAPVFHGLFSHGYQKLCYEMGFAFLVLSGFSYIFGALLYANRIPERFAPGVFDRFFASHQIFHVSVVLAALSHYKCVLTAFHYWHGAGGIAACVARS